MKREAPQWKKTFVMKDCSTICKKTPKTSTLIKANPLANPLIMD
jgi:hypothetical protein